MSAILAPSGRPARLEMRAFYEAGQQRKNRSFIAYGAMSADRDISAAGTTMLSKARYLWKNSPVIRGLVERIVLFSVGCGINPVPASKDTAWNQRAKAVWKRKSRHVELSTGATWGEMCQILCRASLVDGEEFAHLTVDDYGKPRVQLLEAHLCPMGWDATLGTMDGMKLDRFQRPTEYAFRSSDAPNSKVFTRTPDEIVHFIRRVRASQHRGETLLAAAINAAHDVDDIIALEKAAVKQNGAVANVVKTASGEITHEDLLVNGDPQNDSQEALRYYRRVFGPESVVMRRGDEFTPFVSGRPSPAWQGFMDFLCQTICIAANMPPSVLLYFRSGASDNRRDVLAAARAVEQIQGSMIPRLQRTYEHLMSDEIEDGSLVGAPSDWKTTAWQCPRSWSIDAGKDSKEDREDYLVGLTNKRDLLGVWGEDWNEVEDQSDAEARSLIRRAQAIAKEFDIEFQIALNLLSRRDPNAMSAGAAAAPSAPVKDKEDDNA